MTYFAPKPEPNNPPWTPIDSSPVDITSDVGTINVPDGESLLVYLKDSSTTTHDIGLRVGGEASGYQYRDVTGSKSTSESSVALGADTTAEGTTIWIDPVQGEGSIGGAVRTASIGPFADTLPAIRWWNSSYYGTNPVEIVNRSDSSALDLTAEVYSR